MNSTTQHKDDGLADIYIGTAGYSYAHWRKGVFYPLAGVTQNQELRHYSGVFATVEINASFHFVPREETLQLWAKNAKDGFIFSFKAPQLITHEKRLENINGDLKFFFTRLLQMQAIRPSCLGPILFQLPPSLPKDVDKLHRLAEQIPDGIRVAFEFRNRSWYCQEVYDVMRRHGIGLCDNISPDASTLRTKLEDGATTAKVWHYTRFHKRGDQQITNYTNEQLAKIAEKLVERRTNNIVQYCYFLNDHEGNGPRNAKTLMKMIKERSVGKSSYFVKTWKADPVAPSISSLFAKSASTSNTTTAAAASTNNDTRKRIMQQTPSKPKTSKTLHSFFSPASKTKTPSSTNKRPKLNHAQTNTMSKSKKEDIANFFTPKRT